MESSQVGTCKTGMYPSDDALVVNWCEVTANRLDGKVTYKSSFATNHTLADENVAEMVLARRAR